MEYSCPVTGCFVTRGIVSNNQLEPHLALAMKQTLTLLLDVVLSLRGVRNNEAINHFANQLAEETDDFGESEQDSSHTPAKSKHRKVH